jgi:hypothetical protein
VGGGLMAKPAVEGLRPDRPTVDFATSWEQAWNWWDQDAARGVGAC